MDDKFYLPHLTAKRLKEAGYPVVQAYGYIDEPWQDAPITYHEALDWLEGKGYYVSTLHFEQGWSAIVNMVYVNKQRYESRESALRLAIKYVLDILEKGGAQ